MGNDQQERKEFLVKQLEWYKRQDCILEEIEKKLFHMNELVKYACDHDLMSLEIDELNSRLNVLKREIFSLEEQLHSITH
jgi:uncharacterized small protein (DUF1192 family)